MRSPPRARLEQPLLSRFCRRPLLRQAPRPQQRARQRRVAGDQRQEETLKQLAHARGRVGGVLHAAAELVGSRRARQLSELILL